MGRSYSFVVPITPVGKARTRTVTRNGKTHSYTPEKTLQAEERIAWEFSLLIHLPFAEAYPAFPGSEPVSMVVTAYSPRPKTCPKTRIMPVVVPDVDNLGKTIMDALNGWAYYDDKQITTLLVRKRYGSPARLEITLSEDTEEVTND